MFAPLLRCRRWFVSIPSSGGPAGLSQAIASIAGNRPSAGREQSTRCHARVSGAKLTFARWTSLTRWRRRARRDYGKTSEDVIRPSLERVHYHHPVEILLRL